MNTANLIAALHRFELVAASVANELAAADLTEEQLQQVLAAFGPAPSTCRTQVQREQWCTHWLAWLADCGTTWPSELPPFEKPDEPDVDLHQVLIEWIRRT